MIRTTKIGQAGYEIVTGDCPICGRELNFSRKEDLGTVGTVVDVRVSCEGCRESFRLTGDSVNERHETLLLDCHNLLRKKRYMNCILNVCQAYEMFFSLFLRVKLIYVPFGRMPDRGSSSVAKLNQLCWALSRKTGKFGFVKLRNSALSLAVESNPPSTLDEAGEYIKSLSGSRSPKAADLSLLADKKLADLLERVKRTKINQLRNDVVHKKGYRPTRAEAEDAAEEARAVLGPLTWQLELHDDANWYCRGTP